MQLSRVDVQIGDRVEVELPCSEVCMHMGVAGKRMLVEITDALYHKAQLWTLDGEKFSFPVAVYEAGIYRDESGFYFYC